MELVHGGDLYSAAQVQEGDIIDYSANINPAGMPKSVQQAAQQAVTASVHYPDPLCRLLREELSKAEELPQEWILCGNGAADLIFRLVYALRPAKALITAPAFAEYEQALVSAGCCVERYLLHETDEFRLSEAFLEALHPELDCVFLCNPNNPTGQIIPDGLLHQIAQICARRHILLVVDECFLDFLENGEAFTMKPALAENSMLFLLRAFTKLYAIPGLRLGYGLCSNRKLLERMRFCGQPWSVSAPAQAAGIAALHETGFAERTRLMVMAERGFLREGLEVLGLRVFPSAANYLMFRTDREVPLKELLLQQGFLIRSCSNYHGLDKRYYRIAVRGRSENRMLLDAMKRALALARL